MSVSKSATSKQKIRREILAKRQSLSAGEVAQRSEKIFQVFQSNRADLVYDECRSVGLYYPIRGEVDTRPFFNAFKKRKTACSFPRVLKNERLDFFKISDWSELQLGTYGIAEPLSGPDPIRPEVVFVPGVAFSRDGHRLGYGAGYYDRTIDSWAQADHRSSLTLIGIAYDFQVLETVFHEAHDHPVDFLVTETEMLALRSQT